MTEPATPAVSPVTRLLGFAGLLPQLLLVGLEAEAASRDAWGDRVNAMMLALVYAAVILSFLGGMWWGFAMRREGAGQGRLAAVAVVPSLVAAGLLWLGFAFARAGSWAAVGLGSAILLTLLVDRHLTRTREAPAGWMGLRVPLSVGLGGLTIFAGLLGPR